MRTTRRFLVIALALGLAGCWGVPGQNADRTAFNAVESGVTPANVAGLVVAWDHSAGSLGTVPAPMSDPVVAGGSVFAVTAGCFANAVDAATGATRWTAPLNSGYCNPDAFTQIGNPVKQASPPFVDGDRVLFGQFIWDPDITPPRFPFPVLSQTALDAATGAPVADAAPGPVVAGIRDRRGLGTQPFIFSGPLPPPAPPGLTLNTGWAVNATATVGSLDSAADHVTFTLAIPDSAGHLVATLPELAGIALFSAGTGVMSATPGDPAIGPAVREYGLGPGTGQDCGPAATPVTCPLAVAPLPADAATNPIMAPDLNTVYVGAVDGTVVALAASTMAPRWTASLGAAPTATPALADGVLYVPTAAGRLVALDAATGALLWSADLGGPVDVQPAVAGGVVFTGARSGTVAAFAAAGCGATTCAPRWTHDVGAAVTGAPAVSGGQVYVGTADDRIVAFRLG
jgi:outer membrane protein assembly factor BamB